MFRNLKAFSLVLAAAATLGAMGAQGASATAEHSFAAEDGPVVFTGHNESGQNTVWSFNGAAIECATATLEATASQILTDMMTLHPKYSSCTALGTGATVNTDGCNYILDSDTTTHLHSVSDNEDAAVRLECEASHHVTLVVPGCTLRVDDEHASVPVNQSLHGVTYAPISSSSRDSFTLTWTLSTVHYTAMNSVCALYGIPKGTRTDGTVTGKTTLTGYEDSTVLSGSTTAGRTWSHGAQVGIGFSTS